MAKRQTSLLSILQAASKKQKSNQEEAVYLQDDSDDDRAESIDDGPPGTVSTTCVAQCCLGEGPYQPTDKSTLQSLASKNRNFQPSWYKKFPWVSVCLTYKRAFCLYCRYASKHNWIAFSKTGEQQTVFTETGFNNWKKAIEKFSAHEGSLVHKEATLKWVAKGKPTIASRLSSQVQKLQEKRRAGLLLQIEALQFLGRQGLAIQGHTKEQGNLYQLLLSWSRNNEALRS